MTRGKGKGTVVVPELVDVRPLLQVKVVQEPTGGDVDQKIVRHRDMRHRPLLAAFVRAQINQPNQRTSIPKRA